MSNNIKIETIFTPYFTKSDAISIRAQRKYMNAFKGTVVPLIISALLGCITGFIDEENKVILYAFNIPIIVLILCSIFCSVRVHQSNLQKLWYEGRAVAESLKTMSWKFINKVSPFEPQESYSKVEEQFIEDLKIVLENNSIILEKINSESIDNLELISQEMREYRDKSWEVKKRIYLNQRIKEQRDWYRNKTRVNSNKKNNWFFISVVLQVVAILSIFIIIVNPNASSDFFGFFASSSTAIISWIQVNRFQELQQAYSTTALELNIIYNQGEHVKSEKDFIKFVEDAEKAISREHTLWIARRDNSKLKDLLQQN